MVIVTNGGCRMTRNFIDNISCRDTFLEIRGMSFDWTTNIFRMFPVDINICRVFYYTCEYIPAILLDI